ncbi:PaaI family thioesterase [bacterium]|nr:PaaI family thioesterase [bacterium]
MKRVHPEDFESISEELSQKLLQRLKNHAISKMMGFTIDAVRKGYCNMALEYSEEVTNGVRSGGTVHGGIVATLVDTAAAFALSTYFDGQMSFATVQLNINYLARAQSRINAHAQVIRRGSRINVVDVDVYDTEDTPVAKATLNFILTKPMEIK